MPAWNTPWNGPTEAKPFDEVIEEKGVKVLIDPKAILFLLGTEMDYQTSALKSGFIFNNPNQTSACGCGESVQLTPATASPLTWKREGLFDLRWQRSEPTFWNPCAASMAIVPDLEKDLKAHCCCRRWQERAPELKDLDLQRDLNPDWFLSETMVGYVFYVDRFAGNLQGVLDHTRLSRKPRHHLCALHALPETARRRQRWRLLGDGLPRHQPRPWHDGGF